MAGVADIAAAAGAAARVGAAPDTGGSGSEVADVATASRSLTRDTAAVTVWNLVSRLTGFGRVMAMGAALGATAVGDSYQSANLVSNILFELLAGGMLASVLVPRFVALLHRGRRAEVTRLAGSLLGIALVALGVLTVITMAGSSLIMRVLTIGVANGTVREQQVHLGSFLLWFFLPQMVLYAAGAVASALLQADRRFVAAAVAPVFNNVVVIGTMIAFRAMVGTEPTFDLSLAQKLVLGGGTTAGVVVMSVVPLLAVSRAGLGLIPRWNPRDPELRRVAGDGVWAAGHLGLNQALTAVTIVLAGRVSGGVVAYQIAFTFFLLPHAVLSNPIFTTIYPRLAADAHTGRFDRFAERLALGLRLTAFVLIPASALLAALAGPALSVVRLGALDQAGASLVAGVLAAYAGGLLGYSCFFLLTRAAYAAGDVRGPTIVNGGVTAVGAVMMVAMSWGVEGVWRVAMLGIVHAVAVTAGSVVLLRRVVRLIGQPVEVFGPVARDLVAGAIGGLVAWAVVEGLGFGSRPAAFVALLAGAIVGGGCYAGAQYLAGAPELRRPALLLRTAGR